ncbi:MAG: hypothetical protein KF910_02030 [Brevundimonas sp.]|uniref:hypothetical protein n=1 Tax=Brevundimonas sp. TaxID=1871086 RepID=UPI0025BD088D|nr:hypothetical protein [Brevundimonas sp.]MBX3476362.1 hypothetical protein [Brevundimonas sp.]
MAQPDRPTLTEVASTPQAQGEPQAPLEFPVREYIGAMAVELAQMARWDGDETLGCALDVAARLAAQPAPRPGPVEVEREPRRRTRRT